MKLSAAEQRDADGPNHMLFREQRGGLAESMETVVVIGRNRKAVAAWARVLLRESDLFSREDVQAMTPERVKCEFYTRDERIGWDTYLLTSDFEHLPVIGYCNKPLVD